VPADDVSVVEFGTLVGVLATLATSIGGFQARVLERLASSNGAAVRQAVVDATEQHVEPAGARAAYARAPYRTPALRYLYTAGWVAGTKHRAACLLAHLDVADTVSQTIKGMRGSPSTMRALKKLHVTAVQGGNAFARGFVSACG